MFAFIIALFIVLICFCFFLVKYVDLKDLNSNCSKALAQIEELLHKKEDDINVLLKTVSNKKIKKLQKIADDMSLFEIEKILFDYRWEINKISTDDYLNNVELNTVIKNINLCDESLDGLKDYYNTNANCYNLYLDKLKWFFKLFGFNEKELFNVVKVDEYDILKN